MRWTASARVKAVGRWLGDHILGALVGLVVAAIAGVLIAFVFGGGASEPAPLAEQWDEQRATLRKEGWEVTADREVEMRGNTQPVAVLGLHSDGECTGPAARPSDQVRIYEVDEGWLRQAFVFQPSGTGCRAWSFHLNGVADLTGSGRSAVFGEFVGNPLGEPGETVPVVIAWNERDGRYIANPLIMESPDVWVRAKHAEDRPEWFQLHALRMFRKPLRLTQGADRNAYGVSELHFVLKGAEDSYIYGLYRMTSGVPRGSRHPGPPTEAAPILYQRAMWHLEPFGETIAAGWCHLPARRIPALVPLADSSKLLARLAHRGEAWYEDCEAPLLSRWSEAHPPAS